MADILSDIGDFLAAAAPTLASAAGGPFAGLAVTKIEEWLGIGPGASKSDPDAFKVALEKAMASPEQVVELKKLDLGFKQFCLENQLQLERVDAGDRDSARRRQVDLHDMFPNHLAICIFGAFVLTIVLQFALIVMSALYKFTLMPEAYRLLDSATGALGSLAGLVAMFYFGSNRASKAKDDTIASLSK